MVNVPDGCTPCKKCKGAPPRRNQPKCKFCNGKGYLTEAEIRALKGGE